MFSEEANLDKNISNTYDFVELATDKKLTFAVDTDLILI